MKRDARHTHTHTSTHHRHTHTHTGTDTTDTGRHTNKETHTHTHTHTTQTQARTQGRSHTLPSENYFPASARCTSAATEHWSHPALHPEPITHPVHRPLKTARRTLRHHPLPRRALTPFFVRQGPAPVVFVFPLTEYSILTSSLPSHNIGY